MTFNNLFEDVKHIGCNCLNDANVDPSSIFCLKTNKQHLRDNDFKSKWEKDGRPDDMSDCKQICSLKGVSVSLYNDKTKDELNSIFNQLFPSSPKYKPYKNILVFDKECGLAKSTPDKNNLHHHDFFKSDQFDFSKITSISSSLISDNV